MGGTKNRNGVTIFICQCLVVTSIIAGALLNNIFQEIKLGGERVRSELRYEASFEKGETLATYANRIDRRYELGKISEEEYLEYLEEQELFLNEPTNQNFVSLAEIMSKYVEEIEIDYNEEEEDLEAFNAGYTESRTG